MVKKPGQQTTESGKKEKSLLETMQDRSGMRAVSPTLLYHISFSELAREPKLY